MKKRFCWRLAASAVLMAGIGFAGPASSDDTDRSGYTEKDAAYYLPEAVFEIVRPGVEAEFIELDIPADLLTEVTFSVKDPSGDALVPDGADCRTAVDIRWYMAFIPADETDKVNYFGAAGRDSGGSYTDLGGGVYTYKFGTALPADYDVDATHTLAFTARRDLRHPLRGGADGCFAPVDLGRTSDNVVHNFIPSGSGDPMPRDIVTTDTCNKCHNPIAMHGENYREVQLCTQCHNPQLRDRGELGLSYEMSAMIHRVHSSQDPDVGEIHYPVHPFGELAALKDCEVCHTGGTPTAGLPTADLASERGRPMVANPDPTPVCDGSGKGMTEIVWGDAGRVEIRLNSADGKLFSRANGAGSAETGNWVNDGKAFFMVDAADGSVIQKVNVGTTTYGCAGNAPYDYTQYLTKIEEDENGDDVEVLYAAEKHSAWMTNPNRQACGGCHTYIDWETGEGHPGGDQQDDAFCSFCHQADSGKEFDASVKGAHTVALRSAELGTLLVDIKSVTNTGPGQKPTVVYSVKDKNGMVEPASLDRLLFSLSGPNEDFEFYAQEDVRAGSVASGSDWSYTFSAAVPSAAKGSYSVGFEGRITTVVNDEEERDSAENYIVPVAVTDSEPMARRMVVDDAKCEACHSNLSLHGDNRKNATEYCQTCHRPDATDVNRRPEGEPEGIHFKYMIHKIHRGAELENLPYIVYGFGNRPHDYSEVHFPGDLRDCEACHMEDTYTIEAIPEGALPTQSPAAVIPEMEPITAACLACHDSDSVASHALANSSDLGESCATCHGDGKTYSVERVHAR